MAGSFHSTRKRRTPTFGVITLEDSFGCFNAAAFNAMIALDGNSNSWRGDG
jgi:hypothetical protein